MSASAELAAKLEKRNKINEGQLAPTMIEKVGEKNEKMSASDELAAKLEKRTKINDGQLAPTMIDDVIEDENKTGASNELAAKLEKRNRINEGELAPTMNDKGISIYSENPNLTRRTIQHLDEKFKEVATHKSTLNLEELKKLFEGLGCPQTHLTLKGLLREAGKDANTGEVSFREFLAVFRKASSEDIDEESPLKQLAALNEIDVGEKGVIGAKEFFQAKMKASENSSFAREVEQEKMKKAQEEEEAKNKQEAFNEIKAKFCTA